MGAIVAATELSREVGLYLRMARRHVVAVTYHGGVAGYLISPEQYMRILQGQGAGRQDQSGETARSPE